MVIFVQIVGSLFLIMLTLGFAVGIFKGLIELYYEIKKGRIQIKLLKRKHRRELKLWTEKYKQELDKHKA